MHRSSSSCRTLTRNASSETGRPKASRNPLCRLRDKSIQACLTDDDAKALRHVAYRGEAIGMRAFAGHESRLGEPRFIRRAGEVEPAVARNLKPELAYDGGIAADEVEDEAFEVRSLGYVHRRARR